MSDTLTLFIATTVKDIYYFGAPHDNFWTNSQENVNVVYAMTGDKKQLGSSFCLGCNHGPVSLLCLLPCLFLPITKQLE